jgi:hypothetical protein
MGVKTVVVHDTVSVDGIRTEDTFDWYAQDRDGNVWYFGEDTQEFQDGSAVTTGSFEAGVNGALPGIVMPAIHTSAISTARSSRRVSPRTPAKFSA